MRLNLPNLVKLWTEGKHCELGEALTGYPTTAECVDQAMCLVLRLITEKKATYEEIRRFIGDYIGEPLDVGAVSFDQYKRQVMKLAKRQKKSHLVPNSDFLFNLWGNAEATNRLTPEQVVERYCTVEAQRARY